MRHPYTRALLASIPRLSQDGTGGCSTIGGLPPDLAQPPAGCRFAPRCSRATDKCRDQEPALTGETAEHLFACWHPVDGPADAQAADGRAADGHPAVAGPAGRRREKDPEVSLQ